MVKETSTSTKAFNTNNIKTVEVKVSPVLKDPRFLLNAATSVSTAATSIALASQGQLEGYKWFAPLMAVLSAVNAILGYLSKKDVVSKNVKV